MLAIEHVRDPRDRRGGRLRARRRVRDWRSPATSSSPRTAALRAARSQDRLHPGLRRYAAAHDGSGQGARIPPPPDRGAHRRGAGMGDRAAVRPPGPGRGLAGRGGTVGRDDGRGQPRRADEHPRGRAAGRPSRRNWSTRPRSRPSPSPPRTARKASAPSPSVERRSSEGTPLMSLSSDAATDPAAATGILETGIPRSSRRPSSPAPPRSTNTGRSPGGTPSAGGGGPRLRAHARGPRRPRRAHGRVRGTAGRRLRRVRVHLDRLHDPDARGASDPHRGSSRPGAAVGPGVVVRLRDRGDRPDRTGGRIRRGVDADHRPARRRLLRHQREQDLHLER